MSHTHQPDIPEKIPVRALKRFNSFVNLNGSCHLWTGYKCIRGYGTFWLNGKSRKAHRVAYAIENGAADSSLCICHKCDTPSCVNPEHLFAGTHLDNAKDKMSKGRWKPSSVKVDVSGVKNPNHKLTQSQVAKIKKLKGSKKTYAAIGKQFKVSEATIGQIFRGLTWRCLP